MISYPLGYLFLWLTGAPAIYEAIAITYTLVTLGLLVLNWLLRYRASGHAAGVAGPVAAMVYLYGAVATPLVALIPLVTIARVLARRHSVWQSVVGASLSLSITLSVLWLYGFEPWAGAVR